MNKFQVIPNEIKSRVAVKLIIPQLLAFAIAVVALSVPNAPTWAVMLGVGIPAFWLVAMEIAKRSLFGEFDEETYYSNAIVRSFYKACLENMKKRGVDVDQYIELIDKK